MPSSSSPSNVAPTETIVADSAATNSAREAHQSDVREARRTGLRWRRVSRWLGLACFVFGTGLLIYIFLQALNGLARLARPGALNLDFNQIAGNSKEPAAIVQAVVAVFGAEFLRILYLLITGFIASAIAARGIQFFSASESVIDEAVVAQD